MGSGERAAAYFGSSYLCHEIAQFSGVQRSDENIEGDTSFRRGELAQRRVD